MVFAVPVASGRVVVPIPTVLVVVALVVVLVVSAVVAGVVLVAMLVKEVVLEVVVIGVVVSEVAFVLRVVLSVEKRGSLPAHLAMFTGLILRLLMQDLFFVSQRFLYQFPSDPQTCKKNFRC